MLWWHTLRSKGKRRGLGSVGQRRGQEAKRGAVWTMLFMRSGCSQGVLFPFLVSLSGVVRPRSAVSVRLVKGEGGPQRGTRRHRKRERRGAERRARALGWRCCDGVLSPPLTFTATARRCPTRWFPPWPSGKLCCVVFVDAVAESAETSFAFSLKRMRRCHSGLRSTAAPHDCGVPFPAPSLPGHHRRPSLLPHPSS